MTPQEHYREADLILASDPCSYGCPHSGCPHETSMLARAQVHAQLATAGAFLAVAVIRPDDRRAWDRAMGIDGDAEVTRDGLV